MICKASNTIHCFILIHIFRYRVLELSSGISDLSPLQWRHIVTLIVIRIVILFGLVKSIKSIEKVSVLNHKLLNSLNAIIQLPFLELFVIFFKDTKIGALCWSANSIESGQTARTWLYAGGIG